MGFRMAALGRMAASKFAASNAVQTKVFDIANTDARIAYSNGNKTATAVNNNTTWARVCRSENTHNAGKWYFEFLDTAEDGGQSASPWWGIATDAATTQTTAYIGANNAAAQNSIAKSMNGNVGYRMGANSGNDGVGKINPGLGQIVQVAVDFDALKIWFGVAGTWDTNTGVGNPATGSNPVHPGALLAGTYYAAVSIGSLGNPSTIIVQTMYLNAADFTYTPPTGFSAWGSG